MKTLELENFVQSLKTNSQVENTKKYKKRAKSTARVEATHEACAPVRGT